MEQNYGTIALDTTGVLQQRPPEPTLVDSLKAVVYTNFYFNIVLVVCLPLGIIAGALHWSDSAVFIINMFAIIALAKMLDLGTEQLSLRLGQALSALINASFGNAVELIVGVIALKEGLFVVVQSSLIGSVLSNLLLVLGLCFLLAGFKFSSSKFNPKAAGTGASIFVLSLFGFMLPAVFAAQDTHQDHRDLQLSRGTAILMIIMYISLLVFQLVTHKHYFDAEEEEGEHPEMTLPVAVGTLVASTVLIGISAEYLVESLDGISRSWGISETFIGMIILPVVGNAAEHVTACYAAVRGKMDLSIGVALVTRLIRAAQSRFPCSSRPSWFLLDG
jgi:Ca2+:H+ antiporter